MNCRCATCDEQRQLKADKTNSVKYERQVFLALPLPNGVYGQIILDVPIGKHIKFASDVIQPLREVLDMTADHFLEMEGKKREPLFATAPTESIAAPVNEFQEPAAAERVLNKGA